MAVPHLLPFLRACLLAVLLLVSHAHALVVDADDEVVSIDVAGDARLDEARPAPVVSLPPKTSSSPTGSSSHSPSSPPGPVYATECNMQYSEPSVLAMLTALLPNQTVELPAAWREAWATAAVLPSSPIPAAMLKAANNWTENSVGALMNARLPFQALISDGLFEISGVAEYELVVENAVSSRLYCVNSWSQGLPLREMVCGCGAAASASSSPSSQQPMWCASSHVCPSSSSSSSPCSIRVDPFRRACITYKKSAASPATDRVTYRLDVPLLRDSLLWSVGQSAGAYADALLQPQQQGQEQESSPPPRLLLPTIPPMILRLVSFVGAYFPSYLSCFAAGCLLLFSAESLAESPLFHYTIAAAGGGLLALLWVVFTIFRTAETLLSKSIPAYQRYVAPLVHIFYGTSVYYLLFNSQMVQRMLLEGVLKFWEHGVAGLPLAGKIFFGSSVLVSVVVTRLFGLFQPKSTSGFVLTCAIQLVGTVLLYNGTSNWEISLFLLLPVTYLREELLWYYYRLQIEIVAQTSSSSYVKKVSAKTFDAVKRSTTERELKKLQQYLKQNPKSTDAFHDTLFAGGKKEQATALFRFAAGDINAGFNSARVRGFGGFASGGGAGANNNFDDDDDDDDEGGDGDEEEEDNDAGADTRFRTSMLAKSPGSQRKILKKKTSLLFRLAFPLTLFVVVTAVTAFFALNLQNSAHLWVMMKWGG